MVKIFTVLLVLKTTSVSSLTTDLWSQSASWLCPNLTRTTWAAATKWPKISWQTARTLVRDTVRSIWKQFWRGRPVEVNLGVCPRPMLLPAWWSSPHSFLSVRRTQRADCSPRVFLRGLHTTAAGPQPTEPEGFHPSSSKGLPPTFLFSLSYDSFAGSRLVAERFHGAFRCCCRKKTLCFIDVGIDSHSVVPQIVVEEILGFDLSAGDK